MRYAGVIYDDTAAAPGLSLTIFLQGCPIHCKECHNADIWPPEGGSELTIEKIVEIIDKLDKNGVMRKLCIMGGEPMADFNLIATNAIITYAKMKFPDVEIYLWSGYTYEQLQERGKILTIIPAILEKIDVLIDGPYIEKQRDITLQMRGSTNQRIIYLHKDE